MSTERASKQRRRRSRISDERAKAGDLLCYMDQGSFLALRALGRQPMGLITWVYPHAVDEAAVDAVSRRLAEGLLGRLLQRSPLPWGRHRWVANPVPPPVTWNRTPIPVDALQTWRSSLVDLPVDPEHGPGCRFAVQALADGGTAVSFFVSHTIADGHAGLLAVADAIAGRPFSHRFPPPSRRGSLSRLARDAAESIRSLPEAGRALAAFLARPRQQAPAAVNGLPLAQPGAAAPGGPAVEVPVVQIVLDAAACEARGVKIGILLMALATRIAVRMGRVDAQGRVKLVLPVSERQPGDLRGNAVLAVTVLADPERTLADPRTLQRELRSAQANLLRHGHELTPLLPLIPYVPVRLMRRMEQVALGADLPVGCSFFGDLPPELGSPWGEPSMICISPIERFDEAALTARGGQLFLEGYSLGGRMYATVSGHAPGRVTTRADLLPVVCEALAELGMTGTAS
ncbi:hypothetical protein [Aestuariivirga sp.]|jgi:diacylglycerol O-acyltransferase|uniref:hypothetical protein n=1 Tax=Aestuariivirga sp. TaxID=2650926 RepID=UPI003784C23E